MDKEDFFVEVKTFTKTKKEEYLEIDEKLIELENNSNIIRMELNSVELPLFSKDSKRIKNQIKTYHFKNDRSSYLEVEAPNGYSIPSEFEERVFIALTKLIKKNNYNRKFLVTVNDILKNMNLSNPFYYKKIKEAMILLSKTNYTFKNSLYSNKEQGIINKEVISSIMNVTIISKLDKESGNIEQFKDGRLKEIYEVSFTDYFYDNIIEKGYLAFDSEKLLSIENSVARSIYTMLEKWRGYNLYIKRPVFFIVRRIPLSWNKKQIKRTIDIVEKGLIELRNIKLIENYNIIRNKKWELAEIEIFFSEEHNKIKKETFFTDKNEFNGMDIFVTSTEEKIKCLEASNNNDIAKLLNLFPSKVLEMKTFEQFIIESIKKYGYEYVLGTAEYTVIKKPTSYKSYLAKALEGNWADEYISKKPKEIIITKKEIETINTEIILEESNKFSTNLEIFENLNVEKQNEIIEEAYKLFLKESESNDNKIMRNIFEKSKKSFISNIMSENQVEIIPNKNILKKEYYSYSFFLVEVSSLLKEKNIDFNIELIAPIFKVLKEYEDKYIKITYNDDTKIGEIIFQNLENDSKNN